MQRVLICDPDPQLRAELLRAVRNAGYCADEVADPASVEERLASVGYDALVLDVASAADLERLERLVGSRAVAVLAAGADPSVELAVADLCTILSATRRV